MPAINRVIRPAWTPRWGPAPKSMSFRTRSTPYTINNYIEHSPLAVAAKTIAVDPEAYAMLARAKRQGETFSDVVKRTLKPRRPLTDFAGAWKDMPPEELSRIQKAIADGRRLDLARQKRLERGWK